MAFDMIVVVNLPTLELSLKAEPKAEFLFYLLT